MREKYKLRIKKFAIFFLFLFIMMQLLSTEFNAAPLYNARMNVDLKWSGAETKEPIIPREEVKKMDIDLFVEIETGLGFGEGLFEGYYGSDNIFNLEIVDTPKWCSAALDTTLVKTPMIRNANVTFSLYLILDENTPANAGEAYIELKIIAEASALVRGTNETFRLEFVPAFLPIIKTDLPAFNTEEITPDDKAVFPIEIKNIGNAKTKVFLEAENVPKKWSVAITDTLIINEQSTKTAYLSVIPPSDLGYHFEEANIRVKMTPADAENVENKGEPSYASFIIQNRGFSSSGIFGILPIAFVILLALAIIFFAVKKKIKK